MPLQLTYKRMDSDTDGAHYNNLSVDLCENGRLDEGIAN
jgi:hypothetical protein